MFYNPFRTENSFRGVPERALSYKDCTQQLEVSRYYQATVTRTTTFGDGNVLTAAQLNNEFNNLLNALALVNADISATASIATSKINATFPVGTIVGTTDTQTLSNKTVVNSAQTITTDTDGATITFTLGSTGSNVHQVTLGGNRTLAVSGATAGQWFYIRLLQDGTGSRTVTWFSTLKWAGAVAPTLTTTANRADSFAFFCTSAGNYDGYVVGQNIG